MSKTTTNLKGKKKKKIVCKVGEKTGNLYKK